MGENNINSKKDKVIGKINEIKSNIETFIAEVNLNDLKNSINSLVKDAQKDFSKIVDKDLQSMKKKFRKEKADIEKKGKKFVATYKKDLASLQTRFDKLTSQLKSAKKVAPKKATKKVAKKAPVRKATKKVAKK